MDLEGQNTPQKLSHKFIFNYQSSNSQQAPVSPCHYSNKTTPKNLKKSINPRTPKGQSISYSLAACSSLVTGNASSLHSISMAVVHTPPAKRYQRVRNPFEAALAERLHLPLIASPSLFQRPNTPQLSSTQFEWTIEEVSSLKPVNVEPHETQFHDSPDPELEAKAQSAISSYFKEQQIVPSPIDCPLRSQRIILSEINGNTPISKPGRRIRDCSSQTELTLPPILPTALEEALKPYFQPQLAGTDTESEQTGDSMSWLSTNNEIKDISLRRKLFDMHNIVVLENENQKPQSTKTSSNSMLSNSSPISLRSLQHTAIVGKLSDSLDKSSFGSLSPISASDCLSPDCSATSTSKRKSRYGKFLKELEEKEAFSPIHVPARRKSLADIYRSQNANEISKIDITKNNSCSNDDENEHFTPERSSSPMNIMLTNNNIAEFSTDSFNVKVSRLKVNSSTKTQYLGKENIIKRTNKSCTEMDIFQNDNDIEDILENTADIDLMHVSHSSNCSSSQSDTPRCKRRSASRKNLSQSFSANWLQDEDEEQRETSMKIKDILAKKSFVTATNVKTPFTFSGVENLMPVNTTPKKNVAFYRTDSGFNELSQNSTSSYEAFKLQDVPQLDLQQEQQQQQEILVCSTPSTKDNFNFMI